MNISVLYEQNYVVVVVVVLDVDVAVDDSVVDN